MTEEGRILLEKDRFRLCLERMCYQLVEHSPNPTSLCIIGLQPRGVMLSDRIVEILRNRHPSCSIDYGKLDITFYRDDFRMRSKPLAANTTHIDFLIQDKEVILVDDVLYTGRTIQAALSSLQHYGRPLQVRLMTMVDRRFNRELPIQANIVGLTVDALDDAYVRVEWQGKEGSDKVVLFSKKEEAK
jgi:pyrimidine operon attenuation protein/uracil phosphoribosyltransferase